MASKSREVRMEQRRVLEKKLELRLQKLEALGAAKEKDPMVKNLRSQIRETDIRIAAFDKNIAKIEALKQAKAKKLAEKGFVTIAYDASYQGESGGEPRQLENPYIRTEDVSAVIDYLTTLSYVDNTRIGAMGICAGAGYTANAAIQDRRIKAIGTVSAVNIGSIFRNGWENNVKSIDALPYVEAGSNARTSDISSGEYAIMPLAPMKESDAPNEELRQAWEYYHTPRAQYPTAPGYATLRSLNQIITYDAYHMAEVYLTQPMQIVAGSQAGSKWMSDDLYDRASSQDKRYHIVEGANHMDLYDGKAYVAEAISVLAPFFEETL